jgi:hypothetical protein
MSNPDRFVDHFKHCNTVDVGLGQSRRFDAPRATSGLPRLTDIFRTGMSLLDILGRKKPLTLGSSS